MHILLILCKSLLTNSHKIYIIYISLILLSGELAQLGEHLPYKQRVGGSSPSFSTIESLI